MKKFRCTVCGYVYEGDAAPEKCPLCKAPASKFVEVVEVEGGALSFADEHVIGVAKGCDEEIVTMVAIVSTKATAALIPIAVSTFLETRRNGQIPRNCDNTMLFTKIAEININIYSIFFSYLIGLGFLQTIDYGNQIT